MVLIKTLRILPYVNIEDKQIQKTLKNFKIHELSKTFIVAEISANHGGNIKNIFKSYNRLNIYQK